MVFSHQLCTFRFRTTIAGADEFRNRDFLIANTHRARDFAGYFAFGRVSDHFQLIAVLVDVELSPALVLRAKHPGGVFAARNAGFARVDAQHNRAVDRRPVDINDLEVEVMVAFTTMIFIFG